jgi:cholesterol oxidase
MDVLYIERQLGSSLWRLTIKSGGEDRPNQSHTITTNMLIVAAGSLGSTELLLRSQRRGLGLSGAVGRKFGGNGDFFGISYNGRSPCDKNGLGDDPEGNEVLQGGLPGPCISSIITVNDQSLDVERGFILEGCLISPCYDVFSGSEFIMMGEAQLCQFCCLCSL